MNLTQRIGVFLALSCIAVIVFLHSPWTGYEFVDYFSLGSYTGSVDLTFFAWKTTAPVQLWFGRVGNFLAALGLVIAVAAAWYWLYRTPTPESGPSGEA